MVSVKQKHRHSDHLCNSCIAEALSLFSHLCFHIRIILDCFILKDSAHSFHLIAIKFEDQITYTKGFP